LTICIWRNRKWQTRWNCLPILAAEGFKLALDAKFGVATTFWHTLSLRRLDTVAQAAAIFKQFELNEHFCRGKCYKL
jgi:hypothetical protein